MDQRDQLRAALLAQSLEKNGVFALRKQVDQLFRDQPQLGIEEAVTRLIRPSLQQKGADHLMRLSEQGIRIVTIFDPAYPALLRHIPDPPLLLFVKGNMSCLHLPGVAIVGARKFTAYGRGVAVDLANHLAKAGLCVFSGLAAGIDTAAHRAALDAGGPTLAVLGSGIDYIYPASNRHLASELIEREGALVSEYAPGTPIKPFHFPYRNRIISGLCQTTIVVEAQERSGSLITARHCLAQGRDLYAVPGPINSPVSQGTNGLIARGEAQLLLSPEALMSDLAPGLIQASCLDQQVEAAIPDPIARSIYSWLDAYDAKPFDLLLVELDLQGPAAQAHLVELEGRGLVERLPGGCYLRNPLH